MKKTVAALLLLALFGGGIQGNLALQAQADSVKAQERSEIVTLQKTPQEKLYLHLDKPYYAVGDTIWLNGYLLNAITHQSYLESKYIYLELIDQTGTVVDRRKIGRGRYGYDSYFTLSDELKSGEYTLRGYTRFMQNTDPSYFYYQKIAIANAAPAPVAASLTLLSSSKESTTGTVNLKDDKGNPYKKTNVYYRYIENGKEQLVNARTDENGTFSFRIKGVQRNEKAIPFLEVKLDSTIYSYTKRLPLFPPEKGYNVGFYPEGGELVAGVAQTIAFKAERPDGMPVQVSGIVVNQVGDSIASFASDYAGMGRFLLAAEPNTQYSVHLIDDNQATLTLDLPKASEEAFALQLSRRGDQLTYALLRGEKTPVYEKMLLLAHTRGQILFINEINPQKPFGRVDAQGLPAGITQFLLLDDKGNPLSERLYFAAPDSSQFKGLLQCVTPEYEPRDSVGIRLNISQQGDTVPTITGICSLSITDDETVSYTGEEENIVSYLLLSSDLPGRIENPTYYLNPQKRSVQYHADLLMLTNGWRRFNAAELARGIEPTPTYGFEQRQEITGKVTNLFNKPAKKANVTLFSNSSFLLSGVQTDEKGRFTIGGLLFPDSTQLMVSASSKSNKQSTVMITVDEDSFPPVDYRQLFLPGQEFASLSKHAQRVREQRIYNGEMSIHHLKEVVVEKTQRSKVKSLHMAAGIDSKILEEEDIAQYGRQSIYHLVQMLPGIEGGANGPNGIWFSIQRAPTSPKLVIDGVEMPDLNDLQYIMSDDVTQLRIEKGGTAAIYAMGMNGDGGVIILEMKKSFRPTQAEAPLNSCKITPLGYTKRIEFYQPLYHVPQVKADKRPDLRNTLYWNPQIRLDGNAQDLFFYANDGSGRYSYRIEGITDAGIPFSFTGKIHP